ncbi:MAG TPA: hypothetical protein VLH79_03825, partial [Chthonomonadales bacterium]|nr:hypothetical protein [Chthonomonadales bacterium]
MLVGSAAVALLLLAAPGPAAEGPARQEPGYLTPEAAGFRQCVLIYDRPERSADDLLPYVSRWIDGAPRAWN